jgi:hypothetical protein
MNVPQITMPPEAAQLKLEAYRKQLRRRADEEYKAAVAGYAALAAGKPLLNLTDAFNHAGLGEDGRPRLAIARADRKQVMLDVWRDRREAVFDSRKNPQVFGYVGTLRMRIPVDFSMNGAKDGYALVPLVPADVRPMTGSLKDFFILWEVEQWSDRPLTAVPDYDPLLLQHIAGDLYAVIAEWDLTPLERAIMTGRRVA